jgi:hypothetical protein
VDRQVIVFFKILRALADVCDDWAIDFLPISEQRAHMSAILTELSQMPWGAG